jgi:hypothetical protein
MFVCVYSVFVLSCVGSGLATGRSLVQGVLPIVYKCKIKEPHKRRPRPDMGCSAIEEEECGDILFLLKLGSITVVAHL